MDALRHHVPKESGSAEKSLASHTDRFERTIRNASGQSQKRFIVAFDDYLEGVVQQAIDITSLGFDIPDEVISHPDMMFASTDMIILANDITSYDLEQARGDCSLTVIMHKLDTDVDGAMLWPWVADHPTKLEKRP
ncbi:uncharacterized protein F5147DRAFT_777458 [Suillus discolor]|uniref:Uncharacterized protein n=1 Tax=Suillus discolor TaxID=1912936 RepID=A0A9P7JQJ2_9AGAM|nr:uncharacterized protein F5147DRAFT_777458 [Suillus discolor]KAG2098943.1 hypothetical protein F5147DRAFT_777458 [Suillus discolor]